ncbi:MAG: hypothetical protein M3464_07130 [Chloroflexota bacterium]|nr:hypothetical protein [Chloroflexota bacterium]
MGTAMRLSESEPGLGSNGPRTAGRPLLISLLIIGALAAGASVASAKGNDTTRFDDRSATRSTSSQSAELRATAMGISVPLPPPS